MKDSPDPNENPGCIGRLLAIFGIKPRALGDGLPVEHLPYRVRGDFLSKAEHSFFLVLRQMMGEYFTVLTKVNLADLFYVSKPHENRTARNKIDRKHVDFLICDPKTMKPRFAIELDDVTHQRRDRMERDLFVDEVFETAGLPLIRIGASPSYSPTQLGEIFKSALSRNAPNAIQNPRYINTTELDDSVPYCPRCEEPMVLREAKQGKRRGERFYGCVNYPRCKEIISIDVRL